LHPVASIIIILWVPSIATIFSGYETVKKNQSENIVAIDSTPKDYRRLLLEWLSPGH
jgi:hypothetical protein